MLKLYYAPGTCALASHIALQEAGADYTAERLDFKCKLPSPPIQAVAKLPPGVIRKSSKETTAKESSSVLR